MRNSLALLPVALPLLAVPVLLAATSGAVAVPPSFAVLAATAVLFALGAGLGGSRPRLWVDLPLAAALGVAAGHLLFSPGLPFGHDTIAHLWGTWGVYQEIGAGDLFARWLHHLGMGMPLLQFYGPVGFYLTLPFYLAGLSPSELVEAGFLVYGALAGISMYAAALRWTGDRRAALVAAAAYVFAPYRLLDGNYRMALGESAAFLSLPLVFLFATEAGGRRRFCAAALAIGLLIPTHPLTALMAGCGLGIWLLAEGWRGIGSRIARLAGVWILGGAVAAFYVLPFAAEIGNAKLGGLAAGEVESRFAEHGLTPKDLLQRRLWSEVRYSEPRGSAGEKEGRDMPFYFGLVLLSLLPLAAGAGRIPGREDSASPSLPRGLLAVTIATLLLSLDPVAGWTEAAFPPLRSLYFPWRFLAIASFGAAAAAGFAAARLLSAWRSRRWVALVPGVLAGLLILDAAPYTGAPDWFQPWHGFGHVDLVETAKAPRRWRHVPLTPPYPLRVAGLFLPPAEFGADASLLWWAYPEYATPATDAAFFQPEDPAALARAGVGAFSWPGKPFQTLQPAPYARFGGESRDFTRGAGEIAVRHDGRPGQIVVLEQYWPGWQVQTAAGWEEVRPTADGLLRADIGEGQREVRFRFHEARPDRAAGWALSAAALLLSLAVLLGQRVGRRSAAPPPGPG